MKLQDQIRFQIKQALQSVTPDNAPTVYQLIQTEEGYKTVEEMIINEMSQNGFTASASILHVNESI